MTEFDKAWRDLLRANRELDGDYLDFDRRQRAYQDAEDALRRMDEALAKEESDTDRTALEEREG